MSRTVASVPFRLRGLNKRKMDQLTTKAKELGMTPERYVRKLVEEDLELDRQAREMSFAQIMKPVRDEFRASGMSDAEFDELVDRARTRHHNKNTGRKSR